MAGEIFFDNSALSRLVEESDTTRAAILDALHRLGTPRISELNVIETARTTDVAIRRRKLEIYKELTGSVAPMNEPVELLAKLATAHFNCAGSIQAGSQEAYHLLANPSDATDEVRDAMTRWALDQERRFKSLHETMRANFVGPFEGEAAEVMSSEQSFVKFVFETANSTLAGLVTGFYRDATGNDLTPAAVSSFLDAVPAWKVFIAAHLHSLWVRSIKTKGPEKRSAGIVDTDSAVYLTFCDRFITNDHAQFEMLDVANGFNPRKTTVELYPDFRAYLLR
jgi:hypothetical protein